jgi:hypothetical protein
MVVAGQLRRFLRIRRLYLCDIICIGVDPAKDPEFGQPGRSASVFSIHN